MEHTQALLTHGTAGTAAGQVERGACPAQIEVAADGGAAGTFRVRGTANRFGIMRSGRMIHPQAFDDWVARQSKIDIALLAQHGDTPGFSVIGRVDRARVDSAGLHFEGWVASGTDLADEARTLIKQRALSGVSIGWTSSASRYVSLQDRDIDPAVKERLTLTGVHEAYVFFTAELVEVSLVDVADDPGARLAAGLSADGRAVFEALRADCKRMIEDEFTVSENRFVETVAASVLEQLEAKLHRGQPYADVIMGEDGEDGIGCEHCGAGHGGGAASPSPSASLLAHIRQWGQGKR